MALSPLILGMLAVDIFTITSFWIWLKTILSTAAAYRQSYRFILFRLCYRKEFATLFSIAWTSSTKISACLINSQWFFVDQCLIVRLVAWREVFSPLQRRLFRLPFHLHNGWYFIASSSFIRPFFVTQDVMLALCRLTEDQSKLVQLSKISCLTEECFMRRRLLTHY